MLLLPVIHSIRALVEWVPFECQTTTFVWLSTSYYEQRAEQTKERRGDQLSTPSTSSMMIRTNRRGQQQHRNWKKKLIEFERFLPPLKCKKAEKPLMNDEMQREIIFCHLNGSTRRPEWGLGSVGGGRSSRKWNNRKIFTTRFACEWRKVYWNHRRVLDEIDSHGWYEWSTAQWT